MIRFLVVIVVLSSTQIVVAGGDHSIYGIYTNIEAKQGEPSGFEMYFLSNGNPGECDGSVLFQTAEGWVQYPELLDCCKCNTENIQFTSDKFGVFKGTIKNGVLVGEFVELKLKISLPKGLGFWQK